MKKTLSMFREILMLFVGFVLIFGFSKLAYSELIDREGGLVFDTDRYITWLQDPYYALTSGYDADGRMTWDEAMIWAQNLVYYDAVRDVTWDDWRLPTALNLDGSGPCGGLNCTESEMGHMFYVELRDTAGNPVNSGLFPSLQFSFWSSTESATRSDAAWRFGFSGGEQSRLVKNHISGSSAWAVRYGEVPAVCLGVVCEDNDASTMSRCDATTGECLFVVRACNDGNICTNDTLDPVMGCVHTPNAAPCSNGDACSENDLCSGGICQPGTPVHCDDGNPCTQDTCDPKIGCMTVSPGPENVCGDGLDNDCDGVIDEDDPDCSTPGMVAYWKFDESSGVIANDSVGINHGDLINEPQWTTGVSGSAINLDGIDDYMKIPYPVTFDLTKELTIEAWILKPDWSNGELVSKEYSYDVGIFGGNNTLSLYLKESDGGAVSLNFFECTFPVNEWTHIAVTFNGNIMRGYLNGNKVGDYIFPIVVETSTSDLLIGRRLSIRYPDATPFYFKGSIDELAIYNRALNTEEIQQRYTSTVPPSTPDFGCGGACYENQDCIRPNTYCDKASGDCLGEGTCKERPIDCPEILPPDFLYPTCGCDGRTYLNKCDAQFAGVSIAYFGECSVCTSELCDDGNPCNGVETCDSVTGECIPGTPIDCNDGDICTIGTCNASTGSCEYECNWAADFDCPFTQPLCGSLCIDVHCDDGDPCTLDLCDWATGQCYGEPNAYELVCIDGIDDDCDGLVDIADPDCCRYPYGAVATSIRGGGQKPTTTDLQIQAEFTVLSGGCITESTESNIIATPGTLLGINIKVGSGPDPESGTLDGVPISPDTLLILEVTETHRLILTNKDNGGKDTDRITISVPK